ncbi:helix-turn-helix transcriptional regulator [Uliginosibacterium gangwonense]|uniref:helix-turn-helix transcriptional regulator n=1 Tax=Uliginosibacterium gangwonense TaxID=392736 RepID=UPI00035CE0AF|nr:helix-turn-helix transcriptional regulator [Uliginosibacterium gangwonense]
MSTVLYFAMCSALSASKDLPGYSRKIISGDFKGALRSLNALQDKSDSALERSDLLPLCSLADVMLMTGEGEEAEESFRRAQKIMRNDKDMVRILSCRNTGWQALLAGRFSAALNCFLCNTEDTSASVAERIEAVVGASLTYYKLGQQAAAGDALGYARSFSEEQDDYRWNFLLDCVSLDFATHFRIRGSGNLQDHAFWHSSGLFGSTQLALDCEQRSAKLCSSLVEVPLLQARVKYLPELLALSEGCRGAYEKTLSHAQWASSQKFNKYSKDVRLEVAMSALAAGCVDLAKAAVETSPDYGVDTVSSRWNIDHLYCLAKIRQQQGKVNEALGLYHRYALDAIQCLRSETNAIKPLRNEVSAGANVPTDDVGARLPAKYRKAYRYIISNIARSNLSIQEVANHIGVTGRALQLVFKEHLGLSPSEVIRRVRMNGIRGDLLEQINSSSGILQTAVRWGVKSRSTLITSYRKQFSETPSETLQRS